MIKKTFSLGNIAEYLLVGNRNVLNYSQHHYHGVFLSLSNIKYCMDMVIILIPYLIGFKCSLYCFY